jgi:hypothetical protein
MLADFDPTARKIVSQPFQLRGMVAGERIRRVPDYLVCTDSGPLVIDVKPVRALQDRHSDWFERASVWAHRHQVSNGVFLDGPRRGRGGRLDPP